MYHSRAAGGKGVGMGLRVGPDEMAAEAPLAGGAPGGEGRGAPGGAPGGAAGGVMGRAVATLGAWLAGNAMAERERWPLWLPVGLGVGIALYFALPVEPPFWPGLTLLAAGAGAAAFGMWGMWGGRDAIGIGPRAAARRWRAALVLAGLAAVLGGGGLTVAKIRTAMRAAPVLEGRVGPVEVRGRIRHLENLPKGRRITLGEVHIPTVAQAKTPALVRLRLSARGPALRAGQWVKMRAILRPPPAPAAPGAFDFQRHAFFQGIGGVGFALGPATPIAPPEGESVRGQGTWGAQGVGAVQQGTGTWRAWLSALREGVAARARAALGGTKGAIAAALLAGERGAIPKPVLTAMRISGLAHLLAISGLHIGLVAGILFFSLRAVLALVPAVALRFPIKKWAAGGAVLGALAYLAITGATVPTQRAFVMVALVLLAVMVDRTAISMRVVAWAAMIVLLLAPESLLGASFQLSFAAVVALVATYEAVAGGVPSPGAPGPGALSSGPGAGGTGAGGPLSSGRRGGDRGPSWIRRPAVYLAGIALTTIVAGLATAPLAAFQFNRIAVYGLAANLIAVPVTALWIMPWGMAAFLLMPVGLEGPALTAMGWGIGAVVSVAETVSAWPGALARIPAFPVAGLVTIAAGGLWLCLWRRRWRFLGVAAIAAGLATPLLTQPPDILVDGEAKLMGARAADGTWMLSSARKARFRAGIWLRRVGQGTAATWPGAGRSADGRLSCDALGCLYRARGHLVALVRDGRALDQDCRSADIVVSLVPVRGPCPSAVRVIDRFDLWRRGGHAIWLNRGGMRVETVRGRQGMRPWVVRRGRAGKAE